MPAIDDGPKTPTLGSYRITERLGAGGMCTVFRALHEPTGHVVALKVLPERIAENPTALARFFNEAKSLASLDHPGIVAVFDRGFDQGRHYLVCEYMDGGDLNVRVRHRGPLGVAEVLDVARAAANALKFASDRGLIHRDLKPANLLFSTGGVVKLADLGLAIQEEMDHRLTREGTTVGTVDYIAPEQARDSRATSARSDMYSLGCTLYFLLVGAPPFPAKSLTEKIRAHVLDPPPDVRRLRPEVPRRLAELILKLMAKQPEDRFADYDELLAAIDRTPESDQAPQSRVLADPAPNPRAEVSFPSLEGVALRDLLAEELTPSGPISRKTSDRPALPRRTRNGLMPGAGPDRSRTASTIMDEPWIVMALLVGLIVALLLLFLLIKVVIAPVPSS